MFVHYKQKELVLHKAKHEWIDIKNVVNAKAMIAIWLIVENIMAIERSQNNNNNNNKLEEFKNKHNPTEDRTLRIDMVQQ